MNPIYRFEIDREGRDLRQAYPIYKSDLAKEFEKETGEEFYRAKLSGKLTFCKSDYTFIKEAPFDTKFRVFLYISYDNGNTWEHYWQGEFWKTDCEIDEENETIIVTPNVVDEYTGVMAGLEKEYDLMQLPIEIQEVDLDKRPLIQIYIKGANTIGCFLAGMWWEQEVTEPVTSYLDLYPCRLVDVVSSHACYRSCMSK